jgi:carboxylesterase type B
MNSNISKSYESSGVKMSEDCLYLNIYAPQKAYQKLSKVPILVFIQGDNVLKKNIVYFYLFL